MDLTFPIDRVEPGEVPAFSHIFDRFQDHAHEVSLMLRYLCHRFDPKSTDIRRMTSVDDKRREAEKRSGWERPDPVANVDDNGKITFSDGWDRYSMVEGMFFELLDDLQYKFLVSIEIAIDNFNSVIRSPIPSNLSADEKAKTAISIQRALEGNKEAFETRREILAQMTDGEDSAIESISRAVTARRARDHSGKVVK
jgi:hypothetical protein